MLHTYYRKFLPVILMLVICCSGFAQSADEQISNGLNASDYFRLDEVYSAMQEDIESPMLKSFAESILYAAFNQPEQAVDAIDSLIANFQEEIGLENVKNMLINQCWLLLRKGEYGNAYDRMNSFIEQLEGLVPAEFLADVKGNRIFYQTLMDEDKPLLIRPDADCMIPIEIDTIKIKGNENDTLRESTHMFVPAIVNGQQERFIFDTGCGGGLFLSQEYAERFGVRIKFDSLRVSGAVGQGYGQMGILDSLQVGNMIFKNVMATIVFPDPQVDDLYKVNAVLGVDFMVAAGEIQIFPDEKKILFPIKKSSMPSTGRNMMRVVGGDAFFLKVYSGDERLVMLFDTGDVYSHLNGKYYNDHKEFIDLNGIRSRKISGGFGGVKEMEFYSLSSFPMKIGNTPFEIRNMIVETDSNDQSFVTGALGMAFINTFKKVIISFDQMFVDVE